MRGRGGGGALGALLLSPRTGTMPSTHTLLQEARGLPHGTVCTARRQAGGRGRGGNAWESPEGCLMFSVLLRTAMGGERVPFLQYVASLATVEAVRDHAGGEDLGLRIKWPNDLFVGGEKVGGVLCTSAYREGSFEVAVGLGLNYTNSQPTTCVAELMAAQHPERSLPPREALLAGILERLEGHVGILEERGFTPLRDSYTDLWLHTGQEVHFEDGETLVVEGLADSGFLLARRKGGSETFELHPDGNRLDFWSGLLRQRHP